MGPITHLDVTDDSRYLIVNTSRGEARYFDAKNGERVAPSAVSLDKWVADCMSRCYRIETIGGANYPCLAPDDCLTG